MGGGQLGSVSEYRRECRGCRVDFASKLLELEIKERVERLAINFSGLPGSGVPASVVRDSRVRAELDCRGRMLEGGRLAKTFCVRSKAATAKERIPPLVDLVV